MFSELSSPPLSVSYTVVTVCTDSDNPMSWTPSRLSFVTIAVTPLPQCREDHVVHVLLPPGGDHVRVGVRAAILRLRRASRGSQGRRRGTVSSVSRQGGRGRWEVRSTYILFGVNKIMIQSLSDIVTTLGTKQNSHNIR